MMADTQSKILPLGESAVVVEFGNVVSQELNRKAICLAEYLSANPFPGFIESVSAYASTTVFFDVVKVRQRFEDQESSLEAVAEILRSALKEMIFSDRTGRAVIEIPTVFDEQFGPDLKYVSDTCDLSPNEVIELFTSVTYRVYMVGFLPGFAYMGEVDERLVMPRKQQPRQSVPKGSVGIAGRQTGIYPLESPGGWQLIGRTEIELFTPHRESPTLFQAGDLVRFIAI
jgi:inhibitor of KinA